MAGRTATKPHFSLVAIARAFSLQQATTVGALRFPQSQPELIAIQSRMPALLLLQQFRISSSRILGFWTVSRSQYSPTRITGHISGPTARSSERFRMLERRPRQVPAHIWQPEGRSD